MNREERERNKTSKYFLSFLVILIIFSIISRGYTSWDLQEEGSCNRTRNIINQTWGIITDGPSNYTQDSHCEWLIVAPKNYYISLSLKKIKTECSYDYLFIFDGASYRKSSFLLASLSGSSSDTSSNITFIAKSGHMLILLYSDTNYALEGFVAEFHISKCSLNCTGNGNCTTTPNGNLCLCDEGYSGEACHIIENESGQVKSTFEFELISQETIKNRKVIQSVGHSAVKIGDKIYIFGGYDLNSLLNDLIIVKTDDLSSNLIVTQTDIEFFWPKARYGHSYVVHPFEPGFFIHGGKVQGEGITNEFLFYNVTNLSWKLYQFNKLPKLMYHTMASANDGVIYVYGGGTVFEDFSSKLYKFSSHNPEKWTEINSFCCGKSKDRSVLGHSMNYWPKKNALLIFGGIGQDIGRFSRISNQMWIYLITSNVWIQIDYMKNSVNEGGSRAFHTSHIFQDYLIIVGGYSHTHNKDESCYSSQIIIYHLECQTWLPEQNYKRGIFGHSSLILDNENIVIVGGYRGYLTSKITLIPMPQCKKFDRYSCQNDPSCGYCPSDDKCYYKDGGSTNNCTTNIQISASKCPGICAMMKSCKMCILAGCKFCDERNTCQNIVEPSKQFHNQCSNDSLRFNYSSCLLNTGNKAHGVSLFEYKHPANLLYPDSLNRVNSTILHFPRELNLLPGPTLLKLKGFLVDNSPQSFPQNKLELCAYRLSVNLTLKSLSLDQYLNETLGWSDHSSCLNLTWPSGNAATLYADKLEFELTARNRKLNFDRNGRVSLHQISMQTIKNLDQKNLLPYASKNGEFCSDNTNCLACLGDLSCLWFNGTECKSKHSEDAKQLTLSNSKAIINSEADECTTCSDYINCQLCTENDCEWIEDDPVCIRKGRIDNSLVSSNNNSKTASCPSICSMRNNCSSCLSHPPGKCVWCEETKECFSFSFYTSFYQYGQCQEWMDKSSQCSICDKQITCNTCLYHFGCGWSFNEIGGVCTEGDFNGPFNSFDLHNELISSEQMEKTTRKWAYMESCPDLDECELGTHDCHPNASCINIPGSYNCTCDAGFTGNGKECEETCFEPCYHGICTKDLICECFTGWTGTDCGTDCNCNYHSTCETGLCDLCLDSTTGENCEKCLPGFFGDPTKENFPCLPCNCNSHGDLSLDLCDNEGQCYCLNHTTGRECELCNDGYYGNPKDNQPCYKGCNGRVFLKDLKGFFGSSDRAYENPSKYFEHCLWIINAANNEEIKENANNENSIFNNEKSAQKRHIQIHFSPGFQVYCSDNVILVYDGYPKIISNSNKPNTKDNDKEMGRLIATVCNSNDLDDINNEGVYVAVNSDKAVILLQYANTGIMHPKMKSAFNASYQVFNGPAPQKKFDPNPFPNLKLKNNKIYDGYSLHSRFGHVVVVDEWNLWVFGGYSLSLGPLDDIRQFSLSSNKWVPLTITVVDTNNGDDSRPSPRYFLSGVMANRLIYIHGGISYKGVFLSDTWRFDTRNSQWTRLGKNGPKLAGMTLTIGENSDIVIIGGINPETGFSNETYLYNPLSGSNWEEVLTKGAKPIGIFGHSTVYHHKSETFYIFGGTLYELGSTITSGYLFALHWPTKKWSRLPPLEDNQVLKLPSPRIYHTAVSTDSYMIVFGGGRLPSIIAYNYKCNLWIEIGNANIFNVQGGAISLWGNEILLQGGRFEGQTIESILKVYLPKDLCSIQTSMNLNECKGTLGCSYCSSNNNKSQQCYNSDFEMPTECSSGASNIEFWKGTQCSLDWIQDLSCNQFTNCQDCLASWPSHPTNKATCQWCMCAGKCISSTSKICLDVESSKTNCGGQKNLTIQDVSRCPEKICPYSDCEKCASSRNCIWTRQILRSNDYGNLYGLKIHSKPVYDWNCIKKSSRESSSFEIKSSPPDPCPAICSSFTTCQSCLSSVGSEGGYHFCEWSSLLNQCFSPAYKSLICFGGVCGPIIKGESSMCPVDCGNFTQCSTCLQNIFCGWCSTGENGDGSCYSGDFNSNSLDSATSCHRNSWHYFACAKEDECTNGHHTCDIISEICIDLDEGFDCTCRKGYERIKNKCVPICEEGCLNGFCVSPNLCKCSFGYVGDHCEHECHCNGHSECAGVHALDECLDCKNNTMGNQCSLCKPLFVGNAKHGGSCIPCLEYCNGHSNICLSLSDYNELCASNNNTSNSRGKSIDNKTLQRILTTGLGAGPTSQAYCCNCAENTSGPTCEHCLKGHFRGSEDKRQICRKCQCQGHGEGNMCDPIHGNNCACQNNTETESDCIINSSGKTISKQTCWKVQCAKCKEFFLGVPLNGHQCYRTMHVDLGYCFDPKNQESCSVMPKPLISGRTAFFAVQPKFMNVNIRINLDVTHGSVNLYLSPKEDTFIVKSDHYSYIHRVDFDKKYKIELLQGGYSREEFGRNRSRSLENNPSQDILELNYSKLSSSNKKESLESSEIYTFIEEEAAGFTTHLTLNQIKAVLVVRNLRNRLVITIPHEAHELRLTKFYLVLEGIGDVSFGNIFFRQDQLHIDLFVFFSVFFSAFFLFLAGCGIAWKFKVNLETRRARSRHHAELVSLAKRPFALWTIIIEPEQTSNLYQIYSQCRKSCRKGCICIRPVAVEPLEDGQSSVATMMVSLPSGGSTCPVVQLCLASSLTNLTNRYQPIHTRKRRS